MKAGANVVAVIAETAAIAVVIAADVIIAAIIAAGIAIVAVVAAVIAVECKEFRKIKRLKLNFSLFLRNNFPEIFKQLLPLFWETSFPKLRQ